MKKVECFKCEICEAIYPDEEFATTCENAHANVENLMIAETHNWLPEAQYPNTIILENSGRSGRAALYNLVKESSVEDIYEMFPDDE